MSGNPVTDSITACFWVSASQPTCRLSPAAQACGRHCCVLISCFVLHTQLAGVVYISDEAHKQLLDKAYTLFSWTNPLHADVFPSVRQMEAEVVAMTAAMMNGGPLTDAPKACGAMTSGQ